MKNLYAALLTLSIGIAQAQEDLIPISPDGIWIEGNGIWDPFGNFNYGIPKGLAISDTVAINDTLYLQFASFDYCSGGQTFTNEFLLREDSGRYYARQDGDHPERLWFDFTLEVGESVLLDYCYDGIGGQMQEELTVESIDLVVLENGSQRRKWTLAYSDPQSGFYNITEEWIEGIGNVRQGWRHPTAQTCVDIGHWLRCYYENEEWVESFEYMPEGTDCCTIVGIPKWNKPNLVIYPNPVSNVLTIESAGLFSTIEIADNIGRVLYAIHPTSYQITVDMTDYACGSYFIKATTGDGITVAQKFTKN